jgi:hypothetical protein
VSLRLGRFAANRADAVTLLAMAFSLKALSVAPLNRNAMSSRHARDRADIARPTLSMDLLDLVRQIPTIEADATVAHAHRLSHNARLYPALDRNLSSALLMCPRLDLVGSWSVPSLRTLQSVCR